MCRAAVYPSAMVAPTEYAKEVLFNRIINQFVKDDAHIDCEVEEAVEKALQPDRRYDPLTEDEILELFELGASKEFVLFARYDDGEVNSVRENANRALNKGEKPEFGDFGEYMWQGNLYKATMHADNTNNRVLREVFGVEYINAVARLATDTPTPERGYKVNDRERLVFR